MKKNFKKLAILSISAFSLLATHQTSAMEIIEQPPDLDMYSLMIASKYFNNITDYINVSKTCKSYGDLMPLFHRNFLSLNEDKFKLFENIKTYYVTTQTTTFRPLSFNTLPEKVNRIIYKSGTFDINTIKRIMGNERILGKRPRVSYSNLENLSSNVDFNIIFDFDNEGTIENEKTIEFEVRLGDLSLGSFGTININQGIENYNEFAYLVQTLPANMCDITTFNFPEGVREIGTTFQNCKNLTSLTIPNSVENICQKAFYNCENLTNVKIQEGVKQISDQAFSMCKKLSHINIPHSITNIGEKAFMNCENLTSLTIPNSVKTIGNYAFSCCRRLMKIVIPKEVDAIGNCIFVGCRRLNNIIYAGRRYQNTNDFLTAFRY